MLTAANLSVNNADVFLLAAYALLLLVNFSAAICLIELVIYIAIHSSSYSNFHCYIASTLSACVLSSVNIKVSLEIRKAFICYAVIYLLAAVDNFLSYHYDLDTRMDLLLKPAVLIVNSYVLAKLFIDWRRGNAVGFAHYCADRANRYKINSLHLRELGKVKE